MPNPNSSDTADQRAAEKIARAIDGQIFRLNDERNTLIGAAARIADIDAELAVLATEKTRIDGRRPPHPGNGNGNSAQVAAPDKAG